MFSTDFFYDSHVYLGHPSHGIMGFVFLYFIAAYLRKYGITRKIIFGPILLLTVFIVSFLARLFQHYISFQLPNRLQIFEENGIFAVLLSVSSFISFSMIKVKNRLVYKIIAFCSPSLFFVYLIQEHDSFRELFWSAFEHIENYISNPILLSIIAFAILLFGAIVLFYIYKLVKRICIGKMESFISSKIDRFLERK